jgi:hypothetical protein
MMRTIEIRSNDGKTTSGERKIKRKANENGFGQRLQGNGPSAAKARPGISKRAA